MEKIVVGVVTKPQALKGAFRIKPNILNLKHFKKMDTLTINNIDYKIEQVQLRDTFVIAKVEGIDSCEDAEKLRNLAVYGLCEVDESNNLDLDSFSVRVGDICGIIIDINNYGSKDILSVSAKKNFMVPVIDGLIINIDKETKTIDLDIDLFEQVVVYED